MSMVGPVFIDIQTNRLSAIHSRTRKLAVFCFSLRLTFVTYLFCAHHKVCVFSPIDIHKEKHLLYERCQFGQVKLEHHSVKPTLTSMLF